MRVRERGLEQHEGEARGKERDHSKGERKKPQRGRGGETRVGEKIFR